MLAHALGDGLRHSSLVHLGTRQCLWGTGPLLLVAGCAPQAASYSALGGKFALFPASVPTGNSVLAHSCLEFWPGSLWWFKRHKAGFPPLTRSMFLSVVLSQQGVDQEEQGRTQSGFSHHLSPRTVLVIFSWRCSVPTRSRGREDLLRLGLSDDGQSMVGGGTPGSGNGSEAAGYMVWAGPHPL